MHTVIDDEVLALVPQLFRLLACPLPGASDLQLTTMSQYRAMSYLRAFPGASLGDLAAELEINAGSTSDLVDRLVALDLVERLTNTADRRQVVLSLTESARNRVEGLRDVRRTQLNDVREQIGEDAWPGFVAGLDAWVTVLARSTGKSIAGASAEKDLVRVV